MHRLWRAAWLVLPLSIAGLAETDPTQLNRTVENAQTSSESRAPQVVLVVDTSAVPKDVSQADLLASAARAAQRWSSSDVSCTSARLSVEASAEPVPVAHDGRSVVVFRTRYWCRDGQRRRNGCYDPRRAAVTTVYAAEHDSAPIEADVELNAVHYRWLLDGVSADPRRQDAQAEGAVRSQLFRGGESHFGLAAWRGPPVATVSLSRALTHEFGHVLGFEHPCRLGAVAASIGAERACTPSDQMAAVMAPLAPSEAAHLSAELQLDDYALLCAKYPRVTPDDPE